MKNFQEIFPEEIIKYTGWECVQFFEMKSIEECVEAAKKLNPMESEGFVVCDGKFNRVKIKSPQYVALAQSSEKKGITDKRIIEIIRLNESEEFLGYFPHFTEKYKNKKRIYDGLCEFLTKLHSEFKDLELNEFKKQVSIKCPDWSNILIYFQSKNIKSIQDALRNMDIQKLEPLVEKFELIMISDDLENLLKNNNHQDDKRKELKELLMTIFKDNIGEFGSIVYGTDVKNSSFDFYLIEPVQNVEQKIELISKDVLLKDKMIEFKYKDVKCLLSLENPKEKVEETQKLLSKNMKKLIKILKILTSNNGYEIQEKVLKMKKIDKDSNAQLLFKFIKIYKEEMKELSKIETEIKK